MLFIQSLDLFILGIFNFIYYEQLLILTLGAFIFC
jgi:hypothetical protein